MVLYMKLLANLPVVLVIVDGISNGGGLAE